MGQGEGHVELGAKDLADPDLRGYCTRYFESVGAAFLPADDGDLCVQIPKDVDKELTDRPFYWMWVETTGETPPESILYLRFDRTSRSSRNAPDGVRPELIAPGCHRLARIEASIARRGMFSTAYERGALLSPHALVIARVSRICDRQRDSLLSFAQNLVTGDVYPYAMDDIATRALHNERPRGSRLLTAPIDTDDLCDRAERFVRAEISSWDERWARDAEHRLQVELKQLRQYFSAQDEERQAPQTPADDRTSTLALRQLREDELRWRCEPRIEIRLTQFALLYLATPPSTPDGTHSDAKRDASPDATTSTVEPQRSSISIEAVRKSSPSM
ncbi:MAG: hypothetical protein OWT27_05600 [Firmicutes bacterium]|nr:hypothetical protein [Bacillota bacterium]